MPEPLISVGELAEQLHTTADAIYQMRYRGDGPPAVVIGKRKILFRQSDIDRWLNARREERSVTRQVVGGA